MNNALVDATRITFNGIANGSDTDNQYTLTGGSTNSSNGYETLFYLVNRDLNEIKRRTGLATDLNNTFISMAAEFIKRYSRSTSHTPLSQVTVSRQLISLQTLPNQH